MTRDVPGVLRRQRDLLDRRVWLLTAGQLMLSVGRGVLMPFAAVYFYAVQGFPLALVGLAYAIALPSGAVVGLFWGALADRVGRKPLMLLGFAGQAVTTALLAFVATVPQYVAVVVANAVFTSAWNPAARAMVADVTPAARRTRAYGMLYLSNNAGLSVGLLLGGLLAAFLPYRVLFFAEAAGAFAFLGVVLLFVRESFRRADDDPPARPLQRVARHLRGVATPLRDARFLVFSLAALLAGFGWSQLYITYGPYMKAVLGFPDAAIAAVFAVNTVLVVLLQVPLAAWADTRRRTWTYVLANHLLAWSLLGTWAAGRAGGGFATAFAILALSVAVMTVGEILVAPVSAALVAGLAGGERHFGKYMAALDLTWTVSGGLGSIVGGLFFDAGRPMLLWPAVTGLVVVSFAAYAWLGRVLPDEVNLPAREDAPAGAAGVGAEADA